MGWGRSVAGRGGRGGEDVGQGGEEGGGSERGEEWEGKGEKK